MKITNKNNLPNAFVNIANEQRDIVDKHYSVTTLLKGTREVLLTRRYKNTLETDVSDMIWAIWGTAVHYVLEQADDKNMVELRLKQEIKDGYYLTGRCDLYNKEEFTIEDYKTASVWKIVNDDLEDWRKQGMMYAWLAIKMGWHVEKIKFHALLKDWSPSKAKRGGNYPQSAIITKEWKVSALDLLDIEEFIKEKFDDLIANEDSLDTELPLCSKEERWGTPTKWAVMKKGRKSAVKLYDEMPNEVEQPYYIEKREGEDRKCMDYCPAREVCPYWKERYRNG